MAQGTGMSHEALSIELGEVGTVPHGLMTIIFYAVRVFVVLWIALGLANTIAPRWIWRITESWRGVREPGPTYFVIRRVTGVAMLAVAAAFLVLGV
ncbi:DUF6199 family natural product biosynthesis protein [Sulfobacillus harzensis]|uniref:DUF6199 domain-containing protein n=1 Tax=Sulfobacillus harzensis TaxID=2729629 RepID=A0A7Y0Q5J0_9FIRM|nr:DUF6199 family natural product biosynthesis protein [Sulfobacillus harzensis]NMP24364.1 hypothetical protein [Sulfobacillus harzensis]